MTALRTKPGVRFAVITDDLVTMFRALLRVARHPAVPASGLVITSGTDGQHAPTSAHYTGEALDLRTTPFGRTALRAWMSDLAQELGPRYTVLLEDEGAANEHLHVQVAKHLRRPTGIGT